MSYDNAEPKPLKFLHSDGKMVDDEGNVITDSPTLKDFYDQAAPQVQKFLLSDGSVVDENNNLIIKNDYYKKMYDQADPKVAKYLHADGTIDENSGSGSGQVNAYCWGDNDIKVFTDFSSAPDSAPSNDYYVLTADKDDGLVKKTTWEDFGFDDYVYEKVDDSTIKLTSIDDPTDIIIFTRLSDYDFTIW